MMCMAGDAFVTGRRSRTYVGAVGDGGPVPACLPQAAEEFIDAAILNSFFYFQLDL